MTSIADICDHDGGPLSDEAQRGYDVALATIREAIIYQCPLSVRDRQGFDLIGCGCRLCALADDIGEGMLPVAPTMAIVQESPATSGDVCDAADVLTADAPVPNASLRTGQYGKEWRDYDAPLRREVEELQQALDVLRACADHDYA